MPAGSINSHRSVPAYRTASNQRISSKRSLCAWDEHVHQVRASLVSARPGVASCRAAAASCAAAARLLPEPLHGSSPMQFVPMTSVASSVRMPAIDDYGHRLLALDCRHGRVLLLAQGAGGFTNTAHHGLGAVVVLVVGTLDCHHGHVLLHAQGVGGFTNTTHGLGAVAVRVVVV